MGRPRQLKPRNLGPCLCSCPSLYPVSPHAADFPPEEPPSPFLPPSPLPANHPGHSEAVALALVPLSPSVLRHPSVCLLQLGLVRFLLETSAASHCRQAADQASLPPLGLTPYSFPLTFFGNTPAFFYTSVPFHVCCLKYSSSSLSKQQSFRSVLFNFSISPAHLLQKLLSSEGWHCALDPSLSTFVTLE